MRSQRERQEAAARFPHRDDWREGQTDWQAYRLNQPLMPFESTKHAGPLGKQFSLLKLNGERVRVLALKKAELGDEVIVRIVELDGKARPKVEMHFAGPITSAREMNGQEQPVGSATVGNGALTAALRAYQPRTFALKLGAGPAKLSAPRPLPIPLQYDLAAATIDGHPAEGSFDILPDNPSAAQGRALPAEALPRDIEFAGIHFTLAPAGNGRPNALLAKGQTIKLPQQHFHRAYVLAAAVGAFFGVITSSPVNSVSFGDLGTGIDIGRFDYAAAVSTPEPGSMMLLGAGLMGIAALRRKISV